MTKFRYSPVAFCVAACLTVPAVPSALSADKTWDGGGGDNNWQTGANWDLNTAPSATDSLFFSGAIRTGPVNNFAANTQFNGLTFTAGASSFTLSGLAINLAGNITNASSNNQAISLALALQQNVVVNTGAVGSTTANGTTISGVISGASSLEKTGSGRLSLTGANSFSGGLRVSDGTLHTNNATGLGTGTVTLGSVAGGENVMLAIASVNSSNNFVVAAGAGTRTIQGQAGGPAFSGSVSLFNDLILDTIGNVSMGLTTGRITGSNTITVRQSGGTTGSVSLSSANSRVSFTGGVLVESGARFNSGNTGGIMDIGGATLTLNSGATFFFNNGATIGGLNGAVGSVADTGSNSARILTFAGSGNYVYAGNIANAQGAGAGGITARLNYGGMKGTQTLSGTNTQLGGSNIQAGKLILDYSTVNTTKLSDTGILTLRGGTLELKGGGHTEIVASTDLRSAGQVNITRDGGTSQINLGALTWSPTGNFGSSGALNFGENNLALTSTAATNGILGDRARFTVGGADWATVSGTNVVALTSYSTFVGTGGISTGNYQLVGSGTATGNQTFNSLKIASSTGSAQTLELGNQTLALTSKGLLVTGSDNYTIATAGTGALSGEIILHNYSSGTLTLGRTNGTLEHAGTGKTVLTTASTGNTANNQTALYLDSGKLQFSNNNQISGNGNVSLNGGMLIADTSSGNISLTNVSANGHRTIALGTDVPFVDVIGGGTLTLGGVISSASSLVTPIVFGSAASNGTIALTGVNTYTGDTRLDGVRLSVNSDASLGSADSAYKVIFSRNSTLNTTANITTARFYEINPGVTATIETDAATGLTHNGTIVGAGNLRKSGSGSLTLSGVNTYSGNTTISAGTLVLAAAGTFSNSPVINLGTLASQGTLDLTAKSAFAFEANQTVSGYGLINIGSGKTVTVNGDLAPGNSTGVLGVTGNLALGDFANTTLELVDFAQAAGTGFDQIAVSEALVYNGTLTIDITMATTVGAYNLFDFASQSGTFDSIVFVDAGAAGTFDYATGVLTLTAIPEPATWMLAGAGTFLMLMRRRRSHS